MWSRENGSVVAGLTAIGPTAVDGDGRRAHARPRGPRRGALDRRGRHRRGHEHRPRPARAPGLPRAPPGAPVGLLLPVTWSATAPRRTWPRSAGRRSCAAGRASRSPPTDPDEPSSRTASRSPSAAASFADRRLLADPGAHRPARLRGERRSSGTIDWPTTTPARRSPQPPLGPVRHRTVDRACSTARPPARRAAGRCTPTAAADSRR